MFFLKNNSILFIFFIFFWFFFSNFIAECFLCISCMFLDYSSCFLEIFKLRSIVDAHFLMNCTNRMVCTILVLQVELTYISLVWMCILRCEYEKENIKSGCVIYSRDWVGNNKACAEKLNRCLKFLLIDLNIFFNSIHIYLNVLLFCLLFYISISIEFEN